MISTPVTWLILSRTRMNESRHRSTGLPWQVLLYVTHFATNSYKWVTSQKYWTATTRQVLLWRDFFCHELICISDVTGLLDCHGKYFCDVTHFATNSYEWELIWISDVTGVLDCHEFEVMISSFLTQESLEAKGCDPAKLFLSCLDETASLAKRSKMEVAPWIWYHKRHDSFTCDMIYLYVTRLIHV